MAHIDFSCLLTYRSPWLFLPPGCPAVSGLRMVLLDGSGAPAAQQVSGRVTVSFRGGGKTCTWTGDSIKLPPGLKVGTCRGRRKVI